MPWIKRGAGCVGNNPQCRPINRYSEEHQPRVFRRALELIEAEEAAEEEGSDEWVYGAQPLRGVRLPGESYLAVQCCNDYLLLPKTKRSLVWLRARHQRQWEKFGGVDKMTTLDTYKSWSRRYDWQARAWLYDATERSDMDYDFLKQVNQELRRRSTREVER